MRYSRVHFHHFPGHEHHHGHCHEHEVALSRSKDQMAQLLECLCHHNEEHAEELAGYRDEIQDQATLGYLAESVFHLKKSTAKLNDAIAALKRSS